MTVLAITFVSVFSLRSHLKFSVVVNGMRKWVWSYVHKGTLHPTLKHYN